MSTIAHPAACSCCSDLLRARFDRRRFLHIVGGAGLVAAMRRAVDELRASGAPSRVLKPGDAMPSFALPDGHERIVDSAALLARGPLVVKFYRGRW